MICNDIYHFSGLDHPFGATEYETQNIATEQFTRTLLGYYFTKPEMEQLRQEQEDQPMPDNASLNGPVINKVLQQDATLELYFSEFSVRYSLLTLLFLTQKVLGPPVLFAPFFAATARTV